MDTKLKFNSTGRFRILMISDFHAGKDFNPKLVTGIDALIEDSKPDFIIIGGDQCLSKETPEEVREYFARIIEPITRRGLCWAATFGNHDRETGIPIEEEEKVYESLPGCLNTAGPEDVSGICNYRIPVYSADGKEIAYNIWSLDSWRENSDYVENFGMKKDTRFVMPDHFNEGSNQASPFFDQVMWYYNESVELEKQQGRKIPGIMFMHVPIQEYIQICRNPEECSMIGSKRENVGASELNSGLFMACLQRGDIKGIFCGHEHINDFQGVYCGITLAIAGAIGYNMSCHDDLRGGRIIDLYQDGYMSTRTLKLMDVLGLKEAMRDPDYFEGGCKYFIRKIDYT